MSVVWKYQLPVKDEIALMMPEGARVLTVQAQAGVPCLWVLCDPGGPVEERWFRLAGTGHPIADASGLSYVGTFQLFSGGFVGHLFERRPSSDGASRGGQGGG